MHVAAYLGRHSFLAGFRLGLAPFQVYHCFTILIRKNATVQGVEFKAFQIEPKSPETLLQ